jgi:hypothetical protein
MNKTDSIGEPTSLQTLAHAYGVDPRLNAVAEAIRRRLIPQIGVGSRRATRAAICVVLGILVQDPDNIQTIREGKPIKHAFVSAMVQTLQGYSLTGSPEAFVKSVLLDLSSVLRSV